MRIVDKYEDAGYGQCFLRNPEVAGMVQESLKHLDGKQFALLEWCIMPNHVHMLVQMAEGISLSAMMHTLTPNKPTKYCTAKVLSGEESTSTDTSAITTTTNALSTI